MRDEGAVAGVVVALVVVPATGAAGVPAVVAASALAGSAGITVGAGAAAAALVDVAGEAADDGLPAAGAVAADFAASFDCASFEISAFFSSIRRCISETFFSSWASFDSASLSLRSLATPASAWAFALA
ncbi:hypothetical protein LMG26296_03525 [Cupriavidus plantarum]|nr:hypothetical protein LMG26296_03525 [Cupriavidus plantarum]